MIKNLRVSGTISPSGSGDIVGGIAGENNGLITGCTFSGSITGSSQVGGIAGINGLGGEVQGCSVTGSMTGSSMTGGIVGENRGVVSACRNDSYVNIMSVDPGVNLSDVDLDLSADLFTLRTLDTVNIATDTGGIAGYSSGMLLGCTNTGMIGYQHTGYNVGGIAGRSCGYIANCVNQGQVLGRKDIGGIVGQAEPYIVLELSEDMLEAVQRQLERLGQMVDGAADDTDSATDQISSRLAAIGDCIDEATGHTKDLTGRLSDYADGVITQVNRGGDILANAMDQLSSISKRATRLSEEATKGLDQLEQAIRALAKVDGSAAFDGLEAAASSVDRAGLYLEKGLKKLDLGLDQLRHAVRIEDEAAAQAALEEIDSGLADISSAMDELGEAMRQLEASGIGSGEWIAALGDLGDAFDKLSSGLIQIGGGVTHLRENISFDLAMVRDGLKNIQDSLRNAEDGTKAIWRAVQHLEEALEGAQSASDQLNGALGALSDAMGIFARAGDMGTDVLSEMEALFDYLASVDPFQIAHPDEAISASSDALYETLERLNDQMGLLNGTSAASVDNLTDDIRAISSQVGVVMDTLIDAIRDVEYYDPEDSVSDTSEEDIAHVTSGKILTCFNEAPVSGDLSVGGIVGSVAVEYELDPEDDLLRNDAPVYRRAYTLKAILQQCANYGEISGRRNYVGSICGRMDLGLILQCGGYGSAESENGDYIGGIAGYALGTIRNCFAKCTLSGGEYTGGIVGAASNGSHEGGTVSHCYSFVRILSSAQYAGAVSGADLGHFQDNYFVSDTLAGFDHVSAAGRAEPISYAQLSQVEDLPVELRRLRLRFLVDGQSIKTQMFDYGASFDEGIFPDIPEREGYFARWDTGDLSDLRFDTDVCAVYTQYLSALPSAQLRDDGRPILFVEGLFSDSDSLVAVPLEVQAAKPRALQSLSSARRVLERWRLGTPEDGQTTHTARYLSPSGRPDWLELYAVTGTEWRRLDTEVVGSYLLFQLEGVAAEIAVVSHRSIWWIWLLATLALGAIIWLVFFLLRAKRSGGVLRAALKKEGPIRPAQDKKGRRRMGLALAGILLTCCAAAGAWLFASGTADRLAAIGLLHWYAVQPNLTMELTVQTDTGGHRRQVNANLIRTEVDGRRMTQVGQYGAYVYYCDGLVYLEDGRTFAPSHPLPDRTGLLDAARALYQTSDISVYSNNAEKIYSIAVEGAQASGLLDSLFPTEDDLAGVETLHIDLVKRGDGLSAIRCSSSAGGKDTAGTPTLCAELRIWPAAETPALPQAVREQMLTGNAAGESLPSLPRLLTAWGRLNARDPLTAQLALEADCGPLVRNDTLELMRTHVNGVQVHCVRKSGRALYITEGAVLDEAGRKAEEPGDMAYLLEIAYRLSFHSTLEERREGGASIYTLCLDGNSVTETAYALLPEMEKLDLSLSNGQIQIKVEEEDIREIRFSISGSASILTVDVPVSLEGILTFQDSEFIVPEAVQKSIEKGDA